MGNLAYETIDDLIRRKAVDIFKCPTCEGVYTEREGMTPWDVCVWCLDQVFPKCKACGDRTKAVSENIICHECSTETNNS